MRTIALIGKVDKRIIAYPISRALNFIGNTALISDDGAYKRLYNGTGDTGNINKLDIVVSTEYDESLIEKLGSYGVKYDFKVVVSNDKVPSDADYVIYCSGINKAIDTEEEIEVDDGKQHSELIISYSTPLDRKLFSIILKDESIKYIYMAEEMKYIPNITDKNLAKTIATVASEAVGLKDIELYNLLMKKDIEEGKK